MKTLFLFLAWGLLLPSAARALTPTPDYSATVTPTFTATPTVCPACSPTATPTASPTPFPYAVVVEVFDSFGALVQTVYSGRASGTPADISLSAASLIPGVEHVDVLTGVALAPAGPPSWDGMNGFVPAAPGTYYVKVTFADGFGAETVYVQPLAVADGGATATRTPTGAGSPTATAGPGCVAQVTPLCFSLMTYDPVCGCDGVTYTNVSDAACHGIMTYSLGACGSGPAAFITSTPTYTPAPGGLPDLVVSAARISLYPPAACRVGGEPLGMLVTVSNLGDAPAIYFYVSVLNNGTPVGDQLVPSLAAQGSVDLFFDGLSSADTWTFGVDGSLLVYESDETNNTLVQALPVPTPPPFCAVTGTATPTRSASVTPTDTVTPAGSLLYQGFSLQPGGACVGQVLTAVFSVRNNGATILDNVRVSPSPAQIGAGRVILVSAPTPAASLAPAASADFTWVFQAVQAGDLFLDTGAWGTDEPSGAVISTLSHASGSVTLTDCGLTLSPSPTATRTVTVGGSSTATPTASPSVSGTPTACGGCSPTATPTCGYGCRYPAPFPVTLKDSCLGDQVLACTAQYYPGVGESNSNGAQAYSHQDAPGHIEISSDAGPVDLSRCHSLTVSYYGSAGYPFYENLIDRFRFMGVDPNGYGAGGTATIPLSDIGGVDWSHFSVFGATMTSYYMSAGLYFGVTALSLDCDCNNPTPTPTRTVSPPLVSATRTATPSATGTPSATPTRSLTPCGACFTPTPTKTACACTVTATPTPTRSITACGLCFTPTATPSATACGLCFTWTPTPTLTRSPSATASPTPKLCYSGFLEAYAAAMGGSDWDGGSATPMPASEALKVLGAPDAPAGGTANAGLLRPGEGAWFEMEDDAIPLDFMVRQVLVYLRYVEDGGQKSVQVRNGDVGASLSNGDDLNDLSVTAPNSSAVKSTWIWANSPWNGDVPLTNRLLLRVFVRNTSASPSPLGDVWIDAIRANYYNGLCAEGTSTPSSTVTPVLTASPTRTSTRTPTACGLCFTPTATPSITACGLCLSSTRTASPTATPSITRTKTTSFAPTKTPTPTATPTFSPSPTRTPSLTPFAPLNCLGTNMVANPGFDAALLPLGAGPPYRGAWYGGVPYGGGIAVNSVGGYMGYLGESVQDVCVDQSCVLNACVDVGGGDGTLLLEQLNASGAVLTSTASTVVAWGQVNTICLAVGDSGFPWWPGAVTLRVRLQCPQVWSIPTSVQFYSFTLTASSCGSAVLVSPTPPVPPGGPGNSYVYPNPAPSAGPAQIRLDLSQSASVHVEIVNAGGAPVSALDGSAPAGPSSLSLDLGGFAPGVYFYIVHLGYADGSSGALPVQSFMVVP